MPKWVAKGEATADETPATDGKAKSKSKGKDRKGKGEGKGKSKDKSKTEVPVEPVEEVVEDPEEITSPILLALPSEGPHYDKLQLLKYFSLGKKEEAEEENADEGEAVGKKVSLTARPPPLDDDVAEEQRTPSKGSKEKKKVEKKKSGVEEPMSPSQTISLSQEIDSQATMTPEMAWYLNSMYASPMASMYAVASYTTVMLRNIPNRYTRDMLVERLNQGYSGEFDFVYLPIDFNSKCNVGYAFINFRTPTACQTFMNEFHGNKTKTVLPGFSSNKICEVSFARVQGRDENMENLRDEKFIEKLTESPDWQPLFWDDKGEEVPFQKALGTGRTRARSRAESGSGMIPQPFQGSPMAGYPMFPGFGMPPTPLGAASQESTKGGRGRGKGGKGAKAAQQQQNPYGAYPGYFPMGYPGMPPVHPAYAAAMQQAAHAHARAAGGVLDHLAPTPKHGKGKKLDAEGKTRLREQIEYYFTVDNLCKDMYLRSHMTADGWTPVELIATFKRVREFNVPQSVIEECLKSSSTLEVDSANHYLRLKDETQRSKWAQVPEDFRQSLPGKIAPDAKAPAS